MAISLPHQECLPLSALPGRHSFPCDELPLSVLPGLVESPKRTRSLVPCVSLNFVIPGFLDLQTIGSRLHPSKCHIRPSLHSLTASLPFHNHTCPVNYCSQCRRAATPHPEPVPKETKIISMALSLCCIGTCTKGRAQPRSTSENAQDPRESGRSSTSMPCISALDSILPCPSHCSAPPKHFYMQAKQSLTISCSLPRVLYILTNCTYL